jgi:sulfur carrier protein ThiS
MDKSIASSRINFYLFKSMSRIAERWLQMNSEIDVIQETMTRTLSEICMTESKTVRTLLKELGLLHRHFVVLVDGKRAILDEEIQEGQRVIVLPIISGG